MANRHRKIFSVLGLIAASVTVQAQKDYDTTFYQNFPLPYSIRFSLERTGAGLEISPDNSVSPPTASFPFNSGVNAGINLSYKILNLSISKSIETNTKNGSLFFSTKFYQGASAFGGRIGIYNNVASLNDSKNLDVETTIRLFKFTPYWLLNLNHKKFSLAAVVDYTQKQKKSAGAFMFEVNPTLVIAGGKGEHIIPGTALFRSIFEDFAGMSRVTILNFDFRPGYSYTKVFEQGEYFLNGGIWLGPGFGYHAVNAIKNYRGVHWQSSVRMSAAAGMDRDPYFLVLSFKYTNSFTPIRTIGVLSDEGSLALTFGIRFAALEKKIPNDFNEIRSRF